MNHDTSPNMEKPRRYAKGNKSGVEGKLRFGFSYTRHSIGKRKTECWSWEKEGRQRSLSRNGSFEYSVIREWLDLRRVRRRGLAGVGVALLEEVCRWGWALRLQKPKAGLVALSSRCLPADVGIALSVASPEPHLLLCGHAPQPWGQWTDLVKLQARSNEMLPFVRVPGVTVSLYSSRTMTKTRGAGHGRLIDTAVAGKMNVFR